MYDQYLQCTIFATTSKLFSYVVFILFIDCWSPTESVYLTVMSNTEKEKKGEKSEFQEGKKKGGNLLFVNHGIKSP